MKNVSSLKPNDTNSPKTPGGISKSLLTPCRRLGLSRNWRKSGPSPFISPFTSSSTEVTEEKNVTRKRKDRLLNENSEPTDETSASNANEVSSEHIDHTPSRNVEEPRKKRSKILLKAINKTHEQNINEKCSQEQTIEETSILDDNITENNDVVSTPVRTKSTRNKNRPSPLKSRDTKQSVQETATIDSNITENSNISTPVLTKSINIKKRFSPLKRRDIEQTSEEAATISCNITENTEVVTTPVRTKSIKNKKRPSPLTTNNKEPNIKPSEGHNESTATEEQIIANEATYAIKERSPNDLRKECIVVIQRKIFRNVENEKAQTNEKPSEVVNSDSDSDDTPLMSIQKQNSVKLNNKVVMDENDDDFIENIASKVKLNKQKDLKSPKNKLKTVKPVKAKVVKAIIESKPSSQNCFDDDNDDDFDNKKTILIRKTYEKVSKPLKAKSTGSITQRDIDNLKRRIEAKKKLLLAQSLTPDTEELRSLIKKWQKGCQDALIELLELMRNKFPDKEHMDYSEMLQTLKIPPSLVGYDSENDCFNSPDDASIILGQYKDL